MDLQLPKHHLSVTHHLLQTHNTQHLRSILFSLVPQGMSQKKDAQGFLKVLCPSLLKDTPTAKTRMKGLLLPNLDVHLSLQAPSKGCSKNPRKKEPPMNRIFLQVCLTEELKQACLKRQENHRAVTPPVSTGHPGAHTTHCLALPRTGTE